MTVWEVLGLEPTHDVLAIKKAYARQLKLNRPEDDAEAYQRLRASYDWALQHADRHAAIETPADISPLPAPPPEPTPEPTPEPPLTEPPPAPPAPPPPVPQPPSTPQPSVAAEPAPTDYDPRDLVGQTYHYWKEAGDDALVQGWPQLYRVLELMPLNRRQACALHFAQFVIDVQDLPPPFVVALNQYFEWTADYQSERVLGLARSRALAERLSALKEAVYLDGPAREQYKRVSQMAAFVAADTKYRALWLGMLSSARLSVQWQGASEPVRRALGVNAGLAARLTSTLSMAQFVRILFTALVAAAAGMAQLLPDVPGVLSGFAMFGVANKYLRDMATALLGVSRQQLLQRLPRAWRDAGWDPLLVAAAFAALAAGDALLAGAMHGLDWPEQAGWGWLYFGALACSLMSLRPSMAAGAAIWPAAYLLCAVSVGRAWRGSDVLQAASLGWLWVVLAARLAPPLLAWFGRAASPRQWLLRLLASPLLLPALPALLRELAGRESASVALGALCVAVASLHLAQWAWLAPWATAVCVLWLGLTTLLDRAGQAWAPRSLAKLQASGRLASSFNAAPAAAPSHALRYVIAITLVMLCALQAIVSRVESPASPAPRAAAKPANPPPQVSEAYLNIISQAIGPNIHYKFSGTEADAPRAEVELLLASDGRILQRTLVRPSPSEAWNQAVLQAVDKTARIPPDEQGHVPPAIRLGFAPGAPKPAKPPTPAKSVST